MEKIDRIESYSGHLYERDDVLYDLLPCRSGAGLYRGTEGDNASISSEQGRFDTDECISLTSALSFHGPEILTNY